eukprot:COSAG01_NODE_665_length_14398_cov_91.714595_3_plen_194_part_00
MSCENRGRRAGLVVVGWAGVLVGAGVFLLVSLVVLILRFTESSVCTKSAAADIQKLAVRCGVAACLPSRRAFSAPASRWLPVPFCGAACSAVCTATVPHDVPTQHIPMGRTVTRGTGPTYRGTRARPPGHARRRTSALPRPQSTLCSSCPTTAAGAPIIPGPAPGGRCDLPTTQRSSTVNPESRLRTFLQDWH